MAAMTADLTRLRSYAEGRWQDGSGALVPLVDPTTEAVLGHCASGGVDFAAACDYARRVGAPALARLSFAERAERVEAAVKVLHAHRELLIELSVDCAGTTRGDAKFDIDGGLGTAQFYAGIGKSLGARRTILDGDMVQLARSPRYVGQHVLQSVPGLALHINAFNFPIWGLLEKAAPALIAGVPVVAKPAIPGGLLAYRAVELLVAADVLPPGALTVLFCEPEGLLDAVRAGDVVAFTGSSAVGRKVRGHDAVLNGFVRVNIEADSVNAAVLDPGATDETATLFAHEVVREMTQKAGQKCTALRRILVPESRIADVTADLTERLTAVKVGNPRTTGVTVGPLISAAQRDRARTGIAGLAASCRFVHGDGSPGTLVDIESGRGFFVGPTLLRADSVDTARVHDDEVFGPVATLIPYSGDASSAAAAVARGQGGLCASVYSDDRDFVTTFVASAGPWLGRVNVGSEKIAPHGPGHGAVLPASTHGGPGRAGGGQELGGLRGLEFYFQRTVVQGDRPILERALGVTSV